MAHPRDSMPSSKFSQGGIRLRVVSTKDNIERGEIGLNAMGDVQEKRLGIKVFKKKAKG